MKMIWEGLSDVLNLHILADQHKNRLSIISFYIDDLHYIAGVKMLNDQFGIQTRGGCSCAGTYGHYLLNVDPSKSNEITDLISKGDNSHKPGWIRMSIHPTSTNEEINYIIDCIKSLAVNHSKWMENYIFDKKKNSIRYKDNKIEEKIIEHIEGCFNNDFY